ncbi:MAG: BamA/TamA family outer membrane protein, partial [Gemmatimonadetes bacterium]|nr:BamA/TamA family outer membrane protein [Gemmatimonadota bacterium]
RALQLQITDSVIDHAVQQLPRELFRQDGATLVHRLRARREALPDAARRFYALLAGAADVHTTDASEIVEVSQPGDGVLDVVIVAHDTRIGDVEVFRRRFHDDETDEVRLFLHGGDDTVRVRPGPDPGIVLRLIGGGASDVFIDDAGGARFYGDSNDAATLRGSRADVNTRDYDPPPTPPSQPHRDWGRQYRFPLWMGYSPDVGLLIGLGLERYQFGFRKLPWSNQIKLRGAWGTTAGTYHVEGRIRLNRENSATHWLIDARASGLDILNFHGLGNETTVDREDVAYEVKQSVFALAPKFVLSLGGSRSFSVGPSVRYTDTDLKEGQLISELRPYGSGRFAQASVGASLVLDARDRARTPTRGAMLALGGAVTPALLDAEQAWGEASALGTLYVSPGTGLQPTLALRAGARKLFGTYPFQDAAYLGDARTVRLGRDQRFGGDALAHANAELRMKLFRALIVLPADIGVFGLADVGRVWFEDEDSSRWHEALGGGLWLAFLSPENALSIAVAQSAERTGLYISAGFAW